MLGEYLLTVAKHYLAAYNDKLGGGSTSAAMSPEAVTRQLTPEYRRKLATLAEANQAAAATGNGHRRVRDLDGKISDGHERLARAPMIEEEEGFEEGEAEDSSPEDDKVLMVLTEDEKIKAFYERIGYHFHVGGGDDGGDGCGDGHQPKPSSAASSSTPSSSSSPAKKTTTTAAAALNTVTNEEVQQQLTTTSKAVDGGGDKGGNGKCPTMTTTNTTTSSLSSIFDSAEFVRFFGAHPKIGK